MSCMTRSDSGHLDHVHTICTLSFQAAVGMFGYMTDLATVEEKATETITVQGMCVCVCTHPTTIPPQHDRT